jgi:hypothetical protein
MSARFDHELDPLLVESLKMLRAEISRDPQKAAAGRQAYLAQVKALTSEKRNNQPVSRWPFLGLNGWIDTIRKTWTRKEQFKMLATIGTWIVIVSMLFGGTGATALAAQDSLPTDFLYPVKIFGEEMHLGFSHGPQARLELLSRYNERRIGEILVMLGEGQPLAEEWAARWQEQFIMALQASAQMDEPAMIRALEQTRLRLRLQEQRLQAAQANQLEGPKGAVERVRTQLHQQQRLVDGALDDPVTFRLRMRERKLSADQTPGSPAETPVPGGQGDGFGPGPQSTPPCDTCTPALDGTGPGPGPQSTCTPVLDGTGPGPGPKNTPTCDTCTPALDGTGPGPGYQGGDDQPAQPPEQGGRGGGSGQGSGGTSSDGPGTGGTGTGNENSGTGGGNCTSCGSGGGGPHHP